MRRPCHGVERTQDGTPVGVPLDGDAQVRMLAHAGEEFRHHALLQKPLLTPQNRVSRLKRINKHHEARDKKGRDPEKHERHRHTSENRTEHGSRGRGNKKSGHETRPPTCEYAPIADLYNSIDSRSTTRAEWW